MIKKLFYSIAILLSLKAATQENIRLNQLGFFPNAQKIAAVIDTDVSTFQIVRGTSVVFEGDLSKENYWSQSKEDVKLADFSALDIRGTYQLKLPNGELSHSFHISDEAIKPVSVGAIKAYYFNRASTALEEAYAGEFSRAMGHADETVIVLPSAATDSRPAGTIIATPKGWYDAGDYNKYIVNSGISVFTLLAAYENYPAYYDELNLNIPESNNTLPDILDETLWNIEWMATMQDEDGGVYNKTTHANFQGAVMPERATAARYVVAKGTAATLDFAAVMAMASRVYAEYLPEESAKWLHQAKEAWAWAKSNPNVAYTNPPAQNGYPGVNTGGYGDSDFSDEFFWAASELAITTGESSYFGELNLSRNFGWPGWPNVETLGILSLIKHRKSVADQVDTTLIKNKLFGITNALVTQRNSSPYSIPNNSFYWGSNSAPGNQGIMLMQAFNLTGNIAYFNAALSALDYLLGRNATGYSYVTGFGDKTPLNIHHRQSKADNIVAPVPGFLAGGPNPHNTDDCGNSVYPTSNPAQCYVDNWCSYSTNEITINWNAPLVYLSGALDFVYNDQFWTEGEEEVLKSVVSSPIRIYPNPAKDRLEILTSASSSVKGIIYSLTGQSLLIFNESTVDVSSLSSGTYILKVQQNQTTYIEKLIIR